MTARLMFACPPCPSGLHASFLKVLPRVELHGRVYFRHVRCPDRRREAVAEMVALSWRWFLRLAERGKDASEFPTALAGFAARAVRSGRRLCGQDPARDALSARAQQLYHFTAQPLPAFDAGSEALGALRDNTRTPPPEQAAFRCDFPAWLRTRKRRDRKIIDQLMRGERTQVVARKHGLSPARVSQLRREFHDDWRRFCGGDE